MATATEPPDVELVESDGEPMDTSWHRDAMCLFIEIVRYHLRGQQDYHVGGNNFIYFDKEEARKRDFRGPDFFYVKGVRYDPDRPYWVVWKEGGKYPDVILELLSPSTAKADLTTKKEVYEHTFRTPEYFCYDPETQQLQGWRRDGSRYQPIQPNDRGWLWSEELLLWLGTWTGEYQGRYNTWLRGYDREGNMVPLFSEAAAQQAQEARERAEEERQRAEEERQRAEEERHRAEAAEAELARLRAMLGEKESSAGS